MFCVPGLWPRRGTIDIGRHIHDIETPPHGLPACRTASVAAKGFIPDPHCHGIAMAERGRVGQAGKAHTHDTERTRCGSTRIQGYGIELAHQSPCMLSSPDCGLNGTARVTGGMGKTWGRVRGGGGGRWRRAGRQVGTCPVVGGVLDRPPRWGPALYLRLVADVPTLHVSPARSGPPAGR